MQMYIVQDQVGNYVSESSFMHISKSEVVWSVQTGITDIFPYYSLKSRAENIIKKLNNLTDKYHINESLYIKEVTEEDIDKIPQGKYINTYYLI